MTLNFKSLITAILIALTPLSGVVFAETTKTPAAPTAQATPATATAPVTIQPPTDWIIYEDMSYTPVADEISRRLDAARKAFAAKDNKKAAAEMRAVADELKKQAARAAKADTAHAKAEMKLAQDTATRMDLTAKKVTAAAIALERGTIKTQKDLDKTIDKAARADMERRWLVTDLTTWYPVSEEPQRHFLGAVEAYAKKDYQAAATEIRKAASYVRLEAWRATSETKQALQSSVAELDTLAASVEKGVVKDAKAMDKAFIHANHALALAHRVKAAESWARKEYDKVGYELKAAAHGLESAAGWAGAEAKAGASAAVADTKALGEKLASGVTWTRDEVSTGFEALGNAINALGQKIGSSQMNAGPSDRKGGQADQNKMIDQMKDGHKIEGEVLRVEGENYFVKGRDGKEVRVHIDQTTQMTGNIKQGARIDAEVNDQNHALSIRAESPDRRNEADRPTNSTP